ncbi:MAG TPA: hypothetical protein HA257_04745 [Candidatus Methanoperedenaceae archaeon]|nr:hypothetical protein [Candidatus Methanoperedenaceae archaeon]
MRFDEILETCVKIDNVAHIPYPRACSAARHIKKCDYRARDTRHSRYHDLCELGFNGFYTRGETMPCMYSDKPDMCPIFTVSCLDCRHIGECEEDMFFVALSLDPCELGLEKSTHPLYLPE